RSARCARRAAPRSPAQRGGAGGHGPADRGGRRSGRGAQPAGARGMTTVSLPPFSLLLPVYHGDDAAHLRRAFRSATSEQHLPPDEVVLVQDGPVGPALGEVVAEIESAGQGVTVVRLERNVGL